MQKKIGRPLKHPPRNAAKQIEALAADGFSVLGIAKRLGTSKDVLDRWLEENSELQTAFDNGRENERHALHNLLYRIAMEKNHPKSATAAMFLLKARHGYVEGDQGEKGNRVNVVFNLPGALPMNVFETLKVIEDGSASNRNEPVPAQRLIVARSP